MADDKKIKWYYHPVVIVLLSFFVLGPFGLPFIYKSPGFKKYQKIILTVIILVYTTYLGYVSINLGRKLYFEIEKTMNVFQ